LAEVGLGIQKGKPGEGDQREQRGTAAAAAPDRRPQPGIAALLQLACSHGRTRRELLPGGAGRRSAADAATTYRIKPMIFLNFSLLVLSFSPKSLARNLSIGSMDSDWVVTAVL
jgi:hypothetical protein